MFTTISESHISFFESILDASCVIRMGHERYQDYTHDHTEDLHFDPDIVLAPRSVEEVSKVMRYCYENTIAVTPRGAGTGLSGGALAVKGGVSLSVEKLNRILNIDVDNFQATVESGVINEALQLELAKYQLFYPPDPASKGSCFLGGNVAHASGGPKALKYGTTRDYVLNLEVVLPNGDIIWTGANTLKYSTGYNVTHLFIGSEGTLGIITKIVFKVISLPSYNQLMLASFDSASNACKAVAAIFKSGAMPSVCEFVEPLGFQLSSSLTGIPFEIPDHVKAYLLIEVDGNNQQVIEDTCEAIYLTMEEYGCVEVLLADSEEKKSTFWRLRRTIGEATKRNNIYKEEDTVVPRASLPELYEGVKIIGQKYGFRSVCYGHAGDGNLHVNILKDELSDAYWNKEIKEAIREIFHLCKKLNGTISGEHGIGFVQKEFMPILFSDRHLQLMKDIKKVFDPKGILNPDKIV